RAVGSGQHRPRRSEQRVGRPGCSHFWPEQYVKGPRRMRHASSLRSPRSLIRLLSVSLIATTSGCGGGGGGTSTGPVNVSIHWGPRSRALNAPSSALSAKITLYGAALDGGDVTFVVNRDPNPAEYTAT